MTGTKLVACCIAVLGLVTGACGKTSKSMTPPQAAAGNAFGAVRDAAVAAEVPAAIRARQAVFIATDASYPPDEFVASDGKTIVGFDVDLGEAIGAVMGLPVRFRTATFATILTGLSAGKYDLGMSSFTDNAEREKTVDFVTYFQAGASIFVKTGSGNAFKTLAQLCGKTVSIEKGTTEVDDANAANKSCATKMKLQIYDDQNQANLAVITGRAIAALADSQVAGYQVKATGGKVAVSGDYLAPAPYGIAIARPHGAAMGTGSFTKAVLDATKKLFDTGVYKKILQKWGLEAGAIDAPKVNGAAG